LPLPHSLSAEPASEVRWFAPSSSSLRLCRRSPLRFPLASDAFDAAGFRRVLSFPSGSCFLLPRLRYEPQVAPRSVPPALPVIDRRVASILSPSAVPVVKAPGCPFALRLRYRRRSASESPQMLILRSRLTSVPSRLGVPCHPVTLFESPDCSVDSLWASSLKPSPSRPGSLLAQRRRFRPSRVAPKHPSSADPYLLPQVAPASASTAGSMITPWLIRTLHPQLAPWMNLRYQSGTSIPDLISSALLISIHSPQSADHEL
jgi:hypothetical protein